MAGKYNLSNLELELMEFIWQHEDGVYFKDLIQHFVKECGKEWKRQSLRTFLLNLVITCLFFHFMALSFLYKIKHAKST